MDLEWQRHRLLREGNLSCVYDVGANTGQYARMIRREGYAGLLVSFEPVREAFTKLSEVGKRDSAHRCHNVALGDTKQIREIHVSRNGVSSSLRNVSAAAVGADQGAQYVRSEQVQVTTLDRFAAENRYPTDRCYLKIDTQGSELEVLKGAKEIVPNCIAIEIELSILPSYDGQADWTVIHALLNSSGFSMVALQRAFQDYRTGEILEADAIYARLQ